MALSVGVQPATPVARRWLDAGSRSQVIRPVRFLLISFSLIDPGAILRSALELVAILQEFP